MHATFLCSLLQEKYFAKRPQGPEKLGVQVTPAAFIVNLAAFWPHFIGKYCGNILESNN